MSTLADRPALVRAAGCALWRPGDAGTVETAVVHRPKYDDWSLPKGKPDRGEHLLETAHREVVEETGLDVVLGRRSVRTCYEVRGADGRPAPKEVDYWTARWTGGGFAPNDEVDELRWLPVADASALCSHDHDRAVLADLARTDVPRMPALILVRHGHAGHRGDWDGPDDLRPLDERGWREARRLAQVLPLFGPVAVASAERTRCRQTVEPLADALGTDVQSLPELGEEEFAADPQAGLAVVERLLTPRVEPGVTVVCSQGGAIPSVLLSLGVRWEGVAGRLYPPAAKGSVWVLGGRPGRLSADYYRDLEPDPAARDAELS
ncbi:NUDIX hydrolase [Blastococcus deserti]|uniref:NUDIX domain-containing protein n=1 Tax=Blastococcus deserti TaxID=2259033 RepID=A0ABW4X9V2_9ACTN